MARPKRLATAKGSGSVKSTKGAKSTKSTKTGSAKPTPTPLVFKASKITRASDKKKEKEDVSTQVVEEAPSAVRTEEKVDSIETPPDDEVDKAQTPVTPQKRREKRSIEDTQSAAEAEEEPAVKRTKVQDTPALPTRDGEDITPASSFSSLTSDASTAATEVSEDHTTAPSSSSAPVILPKRVARLITVHSSVISLLLVHYATHSTSQPAVLSDYLPQLSRTAGTNVGLTDLRRVVTLSAGSIRIVGTPRRGDALQLVNGISAGISGLGAAFKQHVEKWWREQLAAGSSEDQALESIELAEVVPLPGARTGAAGGNGGTTSGTQKSTTTKLGTPSKGQRRLQDLKSFALTKQTSPSPSASPIKKENEKVTQPAGVTGRGSSLLERIRAKAQVAKSAPPPPPPEVLQRRMGLQFLESIIPILLQLTAPISGAGGRSSKLVVPSTASFPMHTLIANIKTSLQRPVSSEEVERSIRLLADEVAGEFVRIVEWKGDSRGEMLVGVVFDRRGRHQVENWRYVEDKTEGEGETCA